MRSRIFTASAAVCLIVGTLAAFAPSASAKTKLYVGTNAVGNGTSCAHPGYNAIQAAVTAAAAGNTIVVCPGTYSEQVTIQKKLTITGSGVASTFVQIPASPGDRTDSVCNPPANVGDHNQDVIDICGGSAVKVKMSQLTVRGPWGPFPFADCSVQPTGINVAGGATLNLKHAAVTDIRQDDTGGLNGCQGGLGIRVGRAATGLIGHATVASTTVSAYQKGGIVVSNAGSTLSLSKTTIQGVGPTAVIAQNGLQVSTGAKAKVKTTTIRDNECNAPSCGGDLVNQTQSFGILLIDANAGTSVTGSTIKDNDAGIYNDETTGTVPTVNGSTITDNRYGGVEADEGKITLTSDTISGSPTGVEVLSYNGQAVAPQPTITQSVIKGASTTAVSLDDGGSVPHPQAVLTVTKTDLFGTGSPNGYGVQNNDAATVKATSDWWGDANGPSDWSFGAGDGVSANVDFFPWAKTASINSFATCTTNGNAFVAAVPFGVYCGTSGTDLITLTGAGSPTLILGNGGSGDSLTGGGGDDYIIGTPGNDAIDGGPGTDHGQGRGGTDSCTNIEVSDNC